MSQPIWKYVGNIGDVNPLDHGGLFVYTDDSGVYPPEMERIERVSEADNSKYEIHRVVLEPCTFRKGVLSDNPYHPGIKAWFADSLSQIADTMGYSIRLLRRDLCVGKITDRAAAWRAIMDYHGWENGDSYPLKLTRKEAEARYKQGELGG